MRSLFTRVMCVVLLHAPALFAAESDAPRRFAAPDMATAPTPGSAGGIGQVMFSLIIVLAAVFAAAYVFKRLRRFSAAGAHGIELLSQASVGGKERVVIVQVAGQRERLLLGVAGGQVTLLQTLPPDTAADRPVPPSTTPQPPRFGELLRRSLGK
jgi:flagellar protein FliO/FliZ